MRTELEESFDFSRGVDHFQLRTNQGATSMSHEEEDVLLAAGLEKFVDVDGDTGRKVLSFAHDSFHNPEARQYDKTSAQDRLNANFCRSLPTNVHALRALSCSAAVEHWERLASSSSFIGGLCAVTPIAAAWTP
ncbi:hypothetical protein N7520_010199 [Penicillium odoratum]|uniref:uncharacterized protein n=1 Tax=Penicillium odoratum TaxID=1167516 RepID=UPI002548E645|nr:uncharacterized protein N7520_010199 [Penicillium odoratum]KAJ5753282.1 hypothetical protein N7520_010199 [Penicillium odoratum]